MHIVLKTVDIGDNPVCRLGLALGATIMPVHRHTVVSLEDLPTHIADAVFQPSRGWKTPEAMIFHGSLDECLEWLCLLDDRPRRAMIIPTDEIPANHQGRLFRKYALGVISDDEAIRASAEKLGIPAFTLDEHLFVLQAFKLHQEADADSPLPTVLLAGIGEQRGILGDGITLFHSHPWNISRARNWAIMFAKVQGFNIISFLDTDLEVDSSHRAKIERIAPRLLEHKTIVVPLVVESDGSGTRPGSGVIIASTELLVSLDGYDELYTGGGTEDIDLLHRASKAGVEVLSGRASGIVLKHISHPRRPGRDAFQKANEERFNGKLQGKVTDFKSMLKEADHG